MKSKFRFKFIKKIFVFFAIFLLAKIDVTSNNNNKLEFGFSKLNDAWNFNENFDFACKTDFGDFFLQNFYQGTAAAKIENSFRDNENFKFGYEKEIFENIFAEFEANANILSDFTSQNVNNLQRLSSLAGAKLTNNKIGDLKALFGFENNKQFGISAEGFLAKITGSMKDFQLNEFKVNSKLNSEFLFLQDQRKSKDLDFSASIFRNVSDENLLNFDLRYKLMGRDFLQISAAKNVESYSENRIFGNVFSGFELFENIKAKVTASAENIFVNRFFKNVIVNNKNSLITRNYNELKLEIKGEIDVINENFSQNFAVQVDYRGEENYIQQKYELSNDELLQLQNFEAQKDNISTKFHLFYKNILEFSSFDTLFSNITYSKLEYDTPSRNNNDERDELYLNLQLNFHHRFSDLLLFTSKLNFLQNHLVFLKSERSEQNNWNKILSLNFGVIFDCEAVRYSPQFEVLANYTIYDFDYAESAAIGIKSYSFRQISYKDSLIVKLSQKFAISNRISMRYYEQGKLYWGSFSELPQQGNFELSLTPAFVNQLNIGTRLSLGTRLFYLIYGQISSEEKFSNPQKIYTISPDISIKLSYKKLTLDCYGWLEFKYVNENYIGIQPNLFLRTGIRL